MPEDPSSTPAHAGGDITPDRDTAAMQAAIERMRTAVRDGGLFERLRAGVAELALAIARAEAQFEAGAIEPDAAPDGKAVDIAVLRAFEARIEDLIAFLGAGLAAEPAAADETTYAVMPPPPVDIAQPAASVPTSHAATPPAAPLATDTAPQAAAPTMPRRSALLPELDFIATGGAAARSPAVLPDIAVPAAAPFDRLPVPSPLRETATPAPPKPAAMAEPGSPPGSPPESPPVPPRLPPAAQLAEPLDDPADFLLEPVEAAPSADAAAPVPAADPLAPLKAMSEAETVALFS